MKPSVRILFAVVLMTLSFAACKHKSQPLNEELFLGEWYRIKGDVDAYSFLKDENSYIFTGTQGMHPVVYGTWKLEKDKFVIIMDNGTTTQKNFTILNDTLSFNNGDELYTRTPPLDVKYPEVKILTNISSCFPSLKFSSPAPADINWGIFSDSNRICQEFSLKGFSISAETNLPSVVLPELSEYITDYGFESDTLFLSEICNGYLDNNQIVTICTNQDKELKNDSVRIHIASGLIVK